jgi:transcription elongation factor SPT6
MKKKKKPFRQAQGIHSVACQEAQEIFGSVSSLRHKHMMKETAGLDTEKRDEEDDEDEYGCAQQAPSQKILEKQFEPTLLEEKFLTERNDHLRKTDVPERLQVCDYFYLYVRFYVCLRSR